MNKFHKLLLGCALGDSLGLPREGLPAKRAQKIFGSELKHRFIGKLGWVSDDTEHSVFVTQSLIAANGDVTRFKRILQSKLRNWLLFLPAGIGLATLRAILKMWLQFVLRVFPANTAVHSAGNGAAMRSAMIGLVYADDAKMRAEFVSASTKLTHGDVRADIGAQVMANAAAFTAKHTDKPTIEQFKQLLIASDVYQNQEWRSIIEQMIDAANQQYSLAQFVKSIGQQNGVSGYVFHSVPVVLYGWFVFYNDLEAALTEVINLGGDADTTGAMLGSIIAINADFDKLPKHWLTAFKELGFDQALLQKLAEQLENGSRHAASVNLIKRMVRVPIYFVVVLLHGFRRLLPPY